MRIRLKHKSRSDIIFNIVMYVFLGTMALVAFYPLWFVLISSISEPSLVNNGKVLFLPKGVTFEGYMEIFKTSKIWIGYRNTLFYTVFGTLLNVSLTMITAYPLSRKELVGKKGIMLYFIFTMYFGGGLIPVYMLIQNLGLIDSPFVLIVIGAMSIYNLIVTRTYLESTISQELIDAAYLDGCSDAKFFFWVVLPLSKTIIAVLVVFYGVAHWNEYFNALIFIREASLRPLQLVLREILLMTTMSDFVGIEDVEDIYRRQRFAEVIKYGSIVVASVPVLILYPFAQKHFVKGVMVGAVKG